MFDIEKYLPEVVTTLQQRRREECEALEIEYVSAEELQRREIEEQERIAEENCIAELKEACEKKGLDFETENKRVLDRRAVKEAKASLKAAKKQKKADEKEAKRLLKKVNKR